MPGVHFCQPAHAQHFWGGCPGDAPLFHLLPLIVQSGERGGGPMGTLPQLQYPAPELLLLARPICSLVSNVSDSPRFRQEVPAFSFSFSNIGSKPTLPHIEEITILQFFLGAIAQKFVFVS